MLVRSSEMSQTSFARDDETTLYWIEVIYRQEYSFPTEE